MSSRRLSFALAALGGLLYFLGNVGFDQWYLAFACLVPLFLAIDRCRSGRQALALGLVYGLVTYAGGYYWLPASLRRFSALGWPGCLLVSALFFLYKAGRDGLFAWLLFRLRRRGRRYVLAAPAALLSVEMVYPLIFPTFLGNALHPVPLLIQAADLGGPLLLSAVVCLANVALHELVRAGAAGARRRADAPAPAGGIGREQTAIDRAGVLAGTVAVALLAVYGFVRMAQIERRIAVAEPFRVGLVQANMGTLEKRSHPAEGVERHLRQSRALLRRHELDLLLWPETAFPMVLPEVERLRPYVTGDAIDVPLLFGGKRIAAGRKYNTAFLLDGDGRLAGRYDKVHLLPVGEWVPGGERFPVLYELLPRAGRLVPGTRPGTLALGRHRLLVLICYEEILPRFVRWAYRAGPPPHLIVDLTNDAWFGDTNEPWIRLALAKLRAVEHRRYFVRVANSGVSAVLDPLGRVAVQSGVYHRAEIAAEVRLLTGGTLYQRFGDGLGAAALCALALLFWRRGQFDSSGLSANLIRTVDVLCRLALRG